MPAKPYRPALMAAPPADGERIEAVRFRPTGAADGERPPLFTRRRLVLLAGAVAAAWFLWFIFTAKSVRFVIEPAADAIDIDGGFALRLGETHLLRRGDYRLRATLAGYHDLDQRVTIGSARNQTLALAMTRLPGLVTIVVDPEGATVDVMAATDDAADAGAPAPVGGPAPLTASIPAGAQVALISHPRYQPASVEFEVLGMAQPQTVEAVLAPDWADVTIPTRPPGASVLIDDEPSGHLTPGPVPVPSGERRLTVKLAGHRQWQDILYVVAGEPQLLEAVVLERAAGLVAVDSTPRGAEVTIDGRHVGTTPLEATVAPGRAQRVRVFKVGYAPQARTLTVGSEQQRTVAFELEELRGDLAIETQPPQAELWVDGALRGAAGGVHTLAASPHEIEIRKAGYASFRKTVVPQPGFPQELKVRLLTLAEARMEALKRVRTSSEGHELVLLSPGPIRMGASRREPGRRANEVLRSVSLSRLFYLSRHEVTNGQFRAFQADHSSGSFQNIDLDTRDQPVVGISWQQAARYCNWLSAKDGLTPFYVEADEGPERISGFDAGALGYRLPTEAEWAWAARHQEDGEPLRYAWGDALPPPERHGNYADRSAAHLVARVIIDYNDNHNVSAPVGTFPANARGVYDLGGNVAEWVHDYYEIPGAEETRNPLGPRQGQYHVIRGSSWQKGTITDLRLSFRDYGSEGRQDLGFRIARFAE